MLHQQGNFAIASQLWNASASQAPFLAIGGIDLEIRGHLTLLTYRFPRIAQTSILLGHRPDPGPNHIARRLD